jgi:hypothetical protein
VATNLPCCLKENRVHALSFTRETCGVFAVFLLISSCPYYKDNVKSELTRNLQDKLTANVCDTVRLVIFWACLTQLLTVCPYMPDTCALPVGCENHQ